MHLKKIGIGFLAVALMTAVPPILFLMVPGAAFFLLLVPLWAILAIPVVVLGFLVTGQFYQALGAAIFAAIYYLSPLGTLTKNTATYAERSIGKSHEYDKLIEEECAKGAIELKRVSEKPGRVILDDLGSIAYRGYEPADLLAALANVEVIEISRRGPDFFSASATRAERSDACAGGRDSKKLQPVHRGAGPFPGPLQTNICFRRAQVPDPSQDRTPAIILRHGPSVGGNCSAIDVLERSSGGDTLLGRVHYNYGSSHLYPELRRRGEADGGAWFRAILREVLGDDLGDAAVKRLLATN